MNLILTMARCEIRLALRRPLFWVAILLSLAFSILYFLGGVGINVSTGGLSEEEKVHVNGPYQLALFYMAIPFVVYTMFAAIAMATSIVRDEEFQVENVLRSTHLSRKQYLLGKFFGTGAWVIGMLLFGMVVAILTDIITAGIASEGGMDDPRLYGPFNILYHLYPFVCYTLPWFLFAMTAAFYLGERTRSPLLIFASLALLYAFVLSFSDFSPAFLERWSKDTLNVEWDTVRAWVDPSGLSWLTEIYSTEDRGVSFYNTVIPTLDTPFLINRIVFLVLSALCLLRSVSRYGKSKNGSLKALSQASAKPQQKLADQDLALPQPFLHGRNRKGTAGWFQIYRTELRLLRRQPSLWVFAPLIWLFTIPAAFFTPGPWEAEVIVTANRAASILAVALSPWVCAYGACLMIDVMNRERTTRFGDIFLSSPVGTGSLVLAKIMAVFTAMTFLIVGAAAITAAFQVGLHQTPPEPEIYARTIGLLLLPGVLFFLVLAAFFASITSGRVTAYGLLISFGILYMVGLFTGWLDWRGRVIPTSLVVSSDITGIRPYLTELVLNRVLVGAVTLMLLTLSVYFYPRTDEPRLPRLGIRALRTRKLGFSIFFLLFASAFASGVMLDRSMDQGAQAEWREDLTDEYELRNRIKWGSPNQKTPEFTALDLKVAFHPKERRFEVDGLFTVGNHTDQSFPVLPLTVSPDFDIEPEDHIFIVSKDEAGEAIESQPAIDDRNGLYEISLPEPLKPGGETTLRMTYGGILNPGSGKTTPNFGEWIFEDAIFVDSFGVTFLPTVGYVSPDSPNQDTSDSRMTPEELARHFDGVHSSLLGGHGTFSVKLEVSVPSDLTALSSGTMTGERIEGDRAFFNFETDHPVYFFPIMAGRYEVKTQGDCSVYYHKGHEQNIDTILTALDRSKRFYSAIYSPYPFSELRIVEFPRFAGFAMGHPSIIPFSEALGFLTKGDDGISNINFMVTAHEAAHQWWGTVTTPAPVPGAAFLTEALAHYSTLLMEERFNGRVAVRNRRIEFEKLYVESRTPDVERSIVRIDGSEQSDTPLWYNKGGMVFWMVSETIGRENLIKALRTFIEEFAFQYDHPTIHDLLGHIRAQAGPEHEDFLRQWFYEVVLPKPEVTSASSAKKGDGWITSALIKNAGTGTIQLAVEVANRRRLISEVGIQPPLIPFTYDDLPEPYGWDEELLEKEDEIDKITAESDEPEKTTTTEEEKIPYEAIRTTMTLGPGEEIEITVETPFEPKHILLDPDAQILMGGRQTAQKEL